MKRFLWAFCFAVACGGEKPPADDKKPLGGEIAARVGEVPIPASLVLKVAEVQKISPQEALKRLVDDTIAAESARKKGLDKELPERWLLIAAHGRFTADRWAKDARAMGPPNPQEMEAVSKLYWELVDRPPAAEAVHAVVQPKGDKEAARRIAEQIRQAVLDASTPEDFIARAKAVPHPGVDVTAERLTPMVADGRGLGGGGYDPAFAKVANAIPEVGGTSPVSETQFGFHVIRLVQRIPARIMPMEERIEALGPEVYDARARSMREHRLDALKKSTPITVENGVETLLRSVVLSAP